MSDLWELFQKGGYVMYPILLCSVISVAVLAERLIFYNGRETDSSFVQTFRDLLEKGDKEDALERAQKEEGDAAKLCALYLENGEKGLDAVETNANLMLDSYSDNFIYLNIIVTIAPLLGLLGTIFGMIRSFKVFDTRGAAPFAITGGIGEALIATAFGLMVAILAMVIYGILKHKEAALDKKIMRCCSMLETLAPGGAK